MLTVVRLAGGDPHLLSGPGHHHLGTDDAAVGCLGDAAHRSGRDVTIGLRRGRPRACRRRITKGVLATPSSQSTWMTTRPLRSGGGTGDRLGHHQRAGRHETRRWLGRWWSMWRSWPGSASGRRDVLGVAVVKVDVAGRDGGTAVAWSTAMAEPVERTQIFWPRPAPWPHQRSYRARRGLRTCSRPSR